MLHAAELNGPLRGAIDDWTGVYVGVTTSYTQLEDDNGIISDYGEGAGYGAVIGFNYQVNDYLVLGLETDYTVYDINFEKVPFITVEDGVTLRARAGFVINNAMFYASAGLAYARTNIELEDFGTVIGVGAEYRINDLVAIGVDYQHLSFYNFDNANIDANIDTVRARLTFNFP